MKIAIVATVLLMGALAWVGYVVSTRLIEGIATLP